MCYLSVISGIFCKFCVMQKKIISFSCTFLFIPDGSKFLEMLMKTAVLRHLDADAEKQNRI